MYEHNTEMQLMELRWFVRKLMRSSDVVSAHILESIRAVSGYKLYLPIFYECIKLKL